MKPNLKHNTISSFKSRIIFEGVLTNLFNHLVMIFQSPVDDHLRRIHGPTPFGADLESSFCTKLLH